MTKRFSGAICAFYSGIKNRFDMILSHKLIKCLRSLCLSYVVRHTDSVISSALLTSFCLSTYRSCSLS